ncbi:hypothetical protein JI58_03250 [Marinosulfonomonas sp. PRT-SC04]|nr:hypothetical protein JI58_03250 [Marinosulfonomonas sp. PRT-SC04]
MEISKKAKEILLACAIDNLNTTQFPDILCDWLHKHIEFDNITILAYFQDHGPELKAYKGHQGNIYDCIQNIYLAGVYLLDPFHDLHINTSPPGVYRLSDIAPDKFRSNRYYLEYYKKTGMQDEFAFVIHPAAGVSLHICLGRDSSSNTRFSPRDLATAKRIMPLVASLSSAHWGTLRSKGEYTEGNITSKLIEAMQLHHGIMLTTRQAEVAMMVLRGHSSVSIGLKLGLSDQTIKVFRKQLYKKCRISSQAQLFTLIIPILERVSSR